MSDDFSTVSAKRGERAREIEVLRQHYRKHREALVAMTAEAPSEHLATEYQKLIREIDVAMGKIDELEGRTATSRPLVPPPVVDEPESEVPEAETDSSRSRVALIVGAGVLVLALIVYLIWRGSADRPAVATSGTSTTTAVVSDTAPVTPVPAPAVVKMLTVLPASADYGTVRKGTRATRQFEVANNSEEPISIQVERSACRCLFYEYSVAVPPKGKETITVTVDGARAKTGELAENLKVFAKSDPTIAAAFEVRASIR